MTKIELTTGTAMQAEGHAARTTVTGSTLATRLGAAAEKGLYNPSREHDACGVGFVAHMKGEKSHRVISDGLQVLENLTHRGAVGADPLMGDGAGMLVQIPHAFFKDDLASKGIDLPEAGEYGVGFIFFPQDDALRAKCIEVVEQIIASEGEELIGWRDVPVDNASLSKAPDIAGTEPVFASGLHQAQEFQRPGCFRTAPLCSAQGDFEPGAQSARTGKERLLHGFHVEPDHRLQGHVPRLSARRLLSGPQG